MGWGDFNYMNNCKMYEKIESYYWCYKANINCTAHADEKIFFVTKGIEYEYDIILNQKVLLHHEGMFSPVEIDITDELKFGNELMILIYPHPMVEGKLGRDNAAQSCKPAVGYGWDWHPRLLVSGIWNDTYLETRGKKYIKDAEVIYTLSDDLKSADVHFDIDCKGSTHIKVFDMEDNIVYSGTKHDFRLENVKLWWCNGQGTPYLYHYSITSTENEKCGTIGFKKIRLIMNKDAWSHPEYFPKGRSRAPITVELNNRVIFAKGSNWVNPEVFTASITQETYETQVKLAKDANMNILRCWGGAIVNKEPFFDICDKMGIMVWQEFPLACNNYVGTPSYLKILEQEARAIVKRVRRHACHILWCGGNELFNKWSGMTDQSYALRLLNKICYEEDFGKPFIMTAPIKGMGHGNYVFLDKEGLTVYEIYRNSNKSAYSEFGVPAISSKEQLEKIFTEEVIHKPDAGINSPWTIHNGFRAFGVNGHCHLEAVDHIFGKQKTIEDYIDKSNFMQCEGYKCVFEEARKQKPNCSMVINWDFNEPWINAAGNNLIEYPSKPKKAYCEVKSALRPTMPSIRAEHFVYNPGAVLSAELWILNDAPEEFGGDNVEVYFTINGKKNHILLWETGSAGPAENIRGHKINIDIPYAPTQIITLTLEANCGKSEYHFMLINNYVTEKPTLPRLNM